MYCRISLPALANLHSRKTSYMVTKFFGSTKRTKDLGGKKSKQTTKSSVMANCPRTKSSSSGPGEMKAGNFDIVSRKNYINGI